MGDAGDAGLIPESERSLGGGNGNPFQYFCLENPVGRGSWWATVHRVAKSWTRLRVCAPVCVCAHTHTLEVQDQCGSRLVFSAASSWLADSCPLQVPSRCETAVSSHHLCSALAHPWSQCVPTSSSSKDSSHMGLELTLTVSFWLNCLIKGPTFKGKGTQSYKYMYPFSPKLPSYPGCPIILRRVPCAIE